MGSIGGAGSIMARASASSSAGLLSSATVSMDQSVPPSISSTVPLQTIGQTLVLKAMPKYDLCSYLGIGIDNCQCE